MTNAELKVLSDLCHDFAVIREEFDKCREELALEKKCHEEVCAEVLQRAEDNKRLEEELLRISETAANAKQTGFDLQQDIFKLTEERDEARRRLKDAVLMLENMWRDYSQIKWHSKADKKRAADMAAKIKAWSDEKEFHMVQTDKGEWVAK